MLGFSFIKTKELRDIKETVTVMQRSLEDIGWQNTSITNDESQALGMPFKDVINRSKKFFYNNPQAGHWVWLTTQFVFGEGISTPVAIDETGKIQPIIDEFWDDPDNKISLTSFAAQQDISNKLQYEGNLFFILFDDEEGKVKVRILNTIEVQDIIKDPEDRMRNNFYKVSKITKQYNFRQGSASWVKSDFVYYADKDTFDVETKALGIPPEKMQQAKIYHVKINSDINDKYGIPELHRGIDWINAHRTMAGDLATLVKALSQFAWKKKVKGNARQVNALQNSMNAKSNMSNKGPPTGSMQIENEAINLSPMNVGSGGAVIGEKGLKAMQLQVCAASGIPYHYYGDPSTGNLATTKTMELPLLKKFTTRQKLWAEIYNTVLQYVIDRKIEVGVLEGKIVVDQKTERTTYETKIDRTIDVDFPPILETDLEPLARALETAKRAKLVSKETAAKIFLLGANQNNIDEELVKIEEDIEDEPEPPTIIPGVPGVIPKPGQEKPKEMKEAIDTPERTPSGKWVKKNNYLEQRMNGYRKALAGDFRILTKAINENLVSSGEEGTVVGNINNLKPALSKFASMMNKSAEKYYPIAINIGEKFAAKQLELKESTKNIREVNENLLKRRLAWNKKYIDESLTPAIEAKLMETVRQTYETEQEFRTAVNTTMVTFEPRMEQYVGAFWTVEENAVKETLMQAPGEVMVNFAGADDGDTCPGCLAAMEGNPWPIAEVPLPGEQDCLGRCRHAIQVIGKE